MRTPNTTLSIYHGNRQPPGDPDAVATGHLYPSFRVGSESVESSDRTYKWTNILDVPLETDIRDDYDALAPRQKVFIPDKNGQGYLIVFVERRREVRGKEYKHVYLDRRTFVADNGEGCCQGADQDDIAEGQDCCAAEGIPETLFATLNSTGCACINGLTIELTYRADEDHCTWEGTAVMPEPCSQCLLLGTTIVMRFFCTTGVDEDFRLDYCIVSSGVFDDCSLSGCSGGEISPPTSFATGPLVAVFDDGSLNTPCGSGFPVTVTVTE